MLYDIWSIYELFTHLKYHKLKVLYLNNNKLYNIDIKMINDLKQKVKNLKITEYNIY